MSGSCAGASVRSAARSFAERARGFRAASASLAATGPFVTATKLGAAASPRGRWRERPGARPVRTARNCFTIRSSSEWKVTTASRPPGLQHALGRVERAHELAELVVDGDAQPLEDARRRMDAARLGPHEAGDELGELARRLDAALAAALDDGAGDRARAALLAEMEEDVGELGLRGAR